MLRSFATLASKSVQTLVRPTSISAFLGGARHLHGAKPMDGCAAAAHVAYGMSDTHFIFPITPATPMGEYCDEWNTKGKKNMFGHVPDVTEMQSELGVCGSVHGASMTGSLVSTFTCSQGLMLMIPNLYRLAGGFYPAVIHVSARTVAGQGISITCDHSDVMATRGSNMAMLCSSSPQEVMDLGAASHIAAIQSQYPFMHFFDGFRTSHEINTVRPISYEDLNKVYPHEALRQYQAQALNPEHPDTRGTIQNQEHMFQIVEAGQPMLDRLIPNIEDAFGRIEQITGRKYKLFDYVGHPEADRVIVMMGSGVHSVSEMVNHLNSNGEKVGVINVHLFRPFSQEHLMEALPKTVKKICVLDRTREPHAAGEPLYLDVCASVPRNQPIDIVGGRFGLCGKEFTPAMAKSVFDNLKAEEPRRKFVVGIEDDVTHRNLPLLPEMDTTPEGTRQCLFWGIGADGTVGSCKKAISMIVENTPLHGQGYFVYSAHKSGGITVSHLRFGEQAQSSPYLITKADYIACHTPNYMYKFPQILDPIKENGTFVLNSTWETIEDLDKNLPNFVKRKLAQAKAKFYNLNASKIAREVGLGGYINMIMQAGFFKLSGVLDEQEAIKLLKEATHKDFIRKGEHVVEKNYKAIDRALEGLSEITYPAEWADLPDDTAKYTHVNPEWPEFVKEIMMPLNRMLGDNVPVSAFDPRGIMPPGTSKYEKRGFAVEVADWARPQDCSQCNTCAFVCPSSCIRPFLYTDEEAKAAGLDDTFTSVKGRQKSKNYKFALKVSPYDCTGCGVCANACPDDCIDMVPFNTVAEQGQANFTKALSLPEHSDVFPRDTFKGSQFVNPLLEFSSACAGCPQTAMMKVVTQLYGDQMYLGNMAGCSCVWSASYPITSFTTNREGQGVAYGQGLFEDGAEFSFGMYKAARVRRSNLRERVQQYLSGGKVQNPELREALDAWNEKYEDRKESGLLSRTIKKLVGEKRAADPVLADLYDNKDMLAKKVNWVMGGDGWAYDIGFGGLDHVLAQGEDINVIVFDNEVYANTGGQASKSTPRSGIAKFAMGGKKLVKKDLAAMMMTYGNIYVASTCFDADPAHAFKAIKEAEAFKGPSIIINYSPCINHGPAGGLTKKADNSTNAVDSGYVQLYRYNPERVAQGKNPLVIDSTATKEADDRFDSLMNQEVRFASLRLLHSQDEAKSMHSGLQDDFKDRNARKIAQSKL
eukprot:GCRY01000629.1.p1 GENE.GCRY01000629.1~~GCRY01000629.1.p1  ORF type:complete len:1211 (-),score=437.97 GCRY01000629.1:259-3891(-)